MDIDEALSDLLAGRATGEPDADAPAAVAEVWRRRHRNTELGAVVIPWLLSLPGWSYTRLEDELGIPRGTAHRWANRPGAEDRNGS